MSPRARRLPPAVASFLAVLMAVTMVNGCASYLNAEPERKAFPFDGTTLDVVADGVPTDLVATDRDDVMVTIRFDARSGAKERVWRLSGSTLQLSAKCGAIANCDARFRVEVPRDVKVLRAGRPTELRGH